ncbi:hypothetical protein GC106_51180 [Kibdelosporangium sp. 4NS15]|uniref:Methyltransferase domain-containing protein n=1 Tax=Kibdelosporangium persicum TaxID=2698649 RepID=A0ABX2FAG5_9PSEU|nr:hypothetical protein [Kibdelosporangium persicum]
MWQWDPSLYSRSAVYYSRGRLPYPPALAGAMATELGLDGTGRLLDVGCGPGSLTLLLADKFEQALGIDADPDMITEATRLAAGKPNTRWLHMRAEDLPAGLGTFRLITFAQSFHWMNPLCRNGYFGVPERQFRRAAKVDTGCRKGGHGVPQRWTRGAGMVDTAVSGARSGASPLRSVWRGRGPRPWRRAPPCGRPRRTCGPPPGRRPRVPRPRSWHEQRSRRAAPPGCRRTAGGRRGNRHVRCVGRAWRRAPGRARRGRRRRCWTRASSRPA